RQIMCRSEGVGSFYPPLSVCITSSYARRYANREIVDLALLKAGTYRVCAWLIGFRITLYNMCVTMKLFY
ncbi:MAG: hypothetical protein J1F13_02625, partial [Prevotellaceae bacterium]|nr:hypothetical protein [Prevotellaceae bacterium]